MRDGDEDAACAEGGQCLGGGIHHHTHRRSILSELGAEERDGRIGRQIGAVDVPPAEAVDYFGIAPLASRRGREPKGS